MTDADVIVLGGGPGGYLAAERLGQAGRRVLLIESDAVGGTCLNVGCIPTKSLLHSAKVYAHAREGEQFGVRASEVSIDWTQMQAWKQQTVTTLTAGVSAMLEKRGVTVVKGWGRLLGPGRVEVDGTTHEADHVIIATGSAPVMPPITGAVDNPRVVDSTGLLALTALPESLAVIGGGVIGIEFASLFASLGTRVDVIEMMSEICPFMDASLAKTLRTSLTGVSVHVNSRVTAIEDDTVVHLDADGAEHRTSADLVLMAVGRRPLIGGWGAVEAGLDLDRGAVRVDDTMRTNLPNVWAVGDVTGRSLLAHAAYRMAEIAVAHILDTDSARRSGQVLRQHTIPWAVYSRPEAAGVGLTAAVAEALGHRVRQATVPLVLSGRFVAEHGLKAAGQVTLVADGDSGRILGIHMLGDTAPETIWGAAAVLEMELSVDDLRQLVFCHPTISEGIREAAWKVA